SRRAVSNRGPEAAGLHVLPTLWFRNTWTWEPGTARPRLRAVSSRVGVSVVEAEHETLGRRWLVCDGAADLLFTENETNACRLWGVAGPTAYAKDAFHDYVVHGRAEAVNPAGVGTKAAAHYQLALAPGQTRAVRLRLTDGAPAATPSGPTSAAPTSSRCRTSGGTRGTPRGTSPSTPSRWRPSIRTLRSRSSSSSCASGTCTPTVRSPPTSGRSPTSTRRCTRGPCGACTRSTGV